MRKWAKMHILGKSEIWREKAERGAQMKEMLVLSDRILGKGVKEGSSGDGMNIRWKS